MKGIKEREERRGRGKKGIRSSEWREFDILEAKRKTEVVGKGVAVQK